jgi:hypothetical protein
MLSLKGFNIFNGDIVEGEWSSLQAISAENNHVSLELLYNATKESGADIIYKEDRVHIKTEDFNKLKKAWVKLKRR